MIQAAYFLLQSEWHQIRASPRYHWGASSCPLGKYKYVLKLLNTQEESAFVRLWSSQKWCSLKASSVAQKIWTCIPRKSHEWALSNHVSIHTGALGHVWCFMSCSIAAAAAAAATVLTILLEKSVLGYFLFLSPSDNRHYQSFSISLIPLLKRTTTTKSLQVFFFYLFLQTNNHVPKTELFKEIHTTSVKKKAPAQGKKRRNNTFSPFLGSVSRFSYTPKAVKTVI